MSNTVLTRKDMKEPDKFQVAAGQAASWLASRKRHLVIAAAAAVAALVVIAVVQTLQTRKELEAGAAIGTLLEDVGAEISAAPVPGATTRTFPDEQTKQRAVLQAADRVLAQYAGTAAGDLAALTKADAHLKLGEWDAAQAGYERYLAGAAPDDSLRFGGLEGLALVAEGKGDLAAAAKAWERLATEQPKFAARADLERARVLAQAGKGDEAKALLTGFAEKHKDSMLGPQASEQLARLGGK